MGKRIFHIILVFNLIFSPVLPIIKFGATLSILLSVIYILWNKPMHKMLLDIFRNKYLLLLMFIPIFMYVYSCLIAGLKGTCDFSICENYIKQFIYSIASILVFMVLYHDSGGNERYILKTIVMVFGLQTVSMLLALGSDTYLSFVRIFQSSGIDDVKTPIFRKLALSSSGFFNLGAAYGLSFILLMQKIKIQEKVYSWDVIFSGLIITGIMFVARTGLVGVGLGLFYLVFTTRNKTVVGSYALKLCIYVLIVLSAGVVFFPQVSQIFQTIIIPFAFEMFMGESLETSSTNHLMTMWDLDIDFSTFMWGDGLYIGRDNAYYMHTDVGYLRQLLFGGMFFVLLHIILQWYIIFKPVGYKMKLHLFLVVVFLYALILHVKGEIVLYDRVFLSVLYPVLLFYYYKQKLKV